MESKEPKTVIVVKPGTIRIANADAVEPEVGSAFSCPYCRRTHFAISRKSNHECCGLALCQGCASVYVFIAGGTRVIRLEEVERMRALVISRPEARREAIAHENADLQHRCGVWG